MSGLVGPLQLVSLQSAEDEFVDRTAADYISEQEATVSQAEHASTVLRWSVEEVRKWLQHFVSFERERLQEFLHSFQNEGVDGLALLTLQRTHRACLGMTDSEWLLLKASRRRLLTYGERRSGLAPLSKLTVDEVLGAMTPPSTPPSSKPYISFGGFKECHEHSPRKWSIPGLRWSFAKDEQVESLEKEVGSLRGEIVAAEERETTLQAQLDHLDEVLRSAQLAGYLHTRTRWTALPGEPPIEDDTDVDDWTMRFMVLRGLSICFYLRATDFRPQGTIMLNEIQEAGPVPQELHHGGCKRWSAFQITTVHGLRLECSSQLKVQVDSWLQAIGASYSLDSFWRQPEVPSRPFSPAWLKVLPLDESEENKSQEGALFGEKLG